MLIVAGTFSKENRESIKEIQSILKNITDENSKEYDRDFDRFLTAMSQKDYQMIGEICARWKISEESYGGLPAYLITRIAEPLHYPEKDWDQDMIVAAMISDGKIDRAYEYEG